MVIFFILLIIIIIKIKPVAITFPFIIVIYIYIFFTKKFDKQISGVLNGVETVPYACHCTCTVKW